MTVPALVLSLGGLKVTSVAAGLHHTIVCTDAGEILLMYDDLLACIAAERISCAV